MENINKTINQRLTRSLLVGILLFAGSTGFAQTALLHLYADPYSYPVGEQTRYEYYELEYKDTREVEWYTTISWIVNQDYRDLWDESYTPYTLTDLECGATYVVRVRGFFLVNGRPEYGEWGFFVTFTVPEPVEGEDRVLEVGPVDVRCGSAPIVLLSTATGVPETESNSDPSFPVNEKQVVFKEEEE